MGPTRQKCPFPQAYHHHMGFLHGGLHPPRERIRGHGVLLSAWIPPALRPSPLPPPGDASRPPVRAGPRGPDPCAPASTPGRLGSLPSLQEALLHAERQAARRAAPRIPFRATTPLRAQKYTTNAHFGAEKRTGGAAGPWARLAGGEGLQAVGGAEAKPPPRPCPDTYPSHSGHARPCPPCHLVPSSAAGHRSAGHAGRQGVECPARGHAWAAAAGHEGRAGGQRAWAWRAPVLAVSCFSSPPAPRPPVPRTPARGPSSTPTPLPLASPPARLLLAAAGGADGQK
ncbi:translation initiation factor IF-2-like [Penaeus monodon]|uniref:translation initiation factor IF-2-like n=1 Tax=Penaeus monodon TaxID=6687 RepID=UPI0018A7AC4F|nr:translation initiation factor IF-2-like [Penaeus monodon]